MKKKIWLSIVILILLVAGIAFVATREQKLPIVNVDGSIIGKYSIKEVMALNLPYECTFRKIDQNAEVSGTLDTDGQKIRGDFDINITTAQNEKQNLASHLVVLDNTAYIWTSLNTLGFKTPYTNSASTNASPIEQSQIIGLKDKTNFVCRPWNATLNSFDLPSGITFSEVK